MKARTKMKTLLLLGVLLFGFTVSAQSQKVSLDFKNERVEKVLASIKSQTGMSLVFSDQLVDVNRKVTHATQRCYTEGGIDKTPFRH